MGDSGGFAIPRRESNASPSNPTGRSAATTTHSHYGPTSDAPPPPSASTTTTPSISTHTSSSAAPGRKPKRKKPIDPTSGIMLQIQGRPYQSDIRDDPTLQVGFFFMQMCACVFSTSFIHMHVHLKRQPHSSYFKYLGPPAAYLHNPIASLPLFHLRSIIIRDKEKQVRQVIQH